MKMHREHFAASGFQGFVPLAEVLSEPTQVPADFGIYAILRPHARLPSFLQHSPAGRFKGLDPSYPIDRLLE